MKALRLVLALLPTLVLLGWLDSWLGARSNPRHPLNEAAAAQQRFAEKPGARVAVLGSSTSGDWMTPEYLAGVLDASADTVVDGHIKGCLQDCTWAQVRRLLHEDRHFTTVFLGINHGSECEVPDSRRIALQGSLLPLRDLPQLGAFILESSAPTQSFGWLVGSGFSRALADRGLARAILRDTFVGPSRGDVDAWYRPSPPEVPKWIPSCDYSDERTRLMVGITRILLSDLEKLSDRAVLMLLPDRRLAIADAAYLDEWQRHRALQQRLVSDHPRVALMDLTAGANHWESFIDRVHVSPKGRNQQRQAFELEWARFGRRSTASTPLRGPR